MVGGAVPGLPARSDPLANMTVAHFCRPFGGTRRDLIHVRVGHGLSLYDRGRSIGLLYFARECGRASRSDQCRYK